MPVLTLAAIEAAVRSSWSPETCDDTDVAEWSEANPSRGQCGCTALVLLDLLGGKLLMADVRRADGTPQGVHYWVRLAGGIDVDLTRQQFAVSEVVQQGYVVDRPTGETWTGRKQYLLLRERTDAALEQAGVQPARGKTRSPRAP